MKYNMLPRLFIRYASSKSFLLPRINFRYAQQADNIEERNLPTHHPIENKRPHIEGKNLLPQYPIENKRPHIEEGNLPPLYPVESERPRRGRGRGNENLKNPSNDRYSNESESAQRESHSERNMSGKFFGRSYNEIQKEKRLKLEGKYKGLSTVDRKKDIKISGETVFGIHPVIHALQAQRRKIYNLYYKTGLETKNSKIGEILELAKQYNISVHDISSWQLKNSIGDYRVHQGVFCDASPLTFEKLEIESLLEESRDIATEDGSAQRDKSTEVKYQVWLYMDRIQDPMNFGAILRSAYFMGIDRVLTSKESSCRLTGVVSKASAGAAELLPVYQVDDIENLFETLTNLGWSLVSTASKNDTSAIALSQYMPTGNMVLAVGNEGLGISADLQESFKTTISIQPGQALQPGMDSLNVSVATAIILHDITSKVSAIKTGNDR